jgi:hypothetical protein
MPWICYFLEFFASAFEQGMSSRKLFCGASKDRHSKAKEISFFDSVTIQNGRKCALLFTVKATNESGHTEPGDKVFFFFKVIVAVVF